MPTGKEIMDSVSATLADAAHDRWPLAELATYINEGVKAIVLAKPSASSGTRIVDLVAGTKQSVPQTGTPTPLRMIDAICNVTASTPAIVRGRAVTPVGRNILDAQEPNWHDARYARQRKEVRHIIFDEDNPLEYYVYPGNDGTGKLEILTSQLPAPLVFYSDQDEPDPNDTINYDQDLGLQDLYTSPLNDYTLYKAFLKDDLQGSPERAALHLQAFQGAVGIKIKVEGATSLNNRRAGS